MLYIYKYFTFIYLAKNLEYSNTLANKITIFLHYSCFIPDITKSIYFNVNEPVNQDMVQY